MVNICCTEIDSFVSEYRKFSPYYRQIGDKRGHFNLQYNYLKRVIEEYCPNTILDASCGTGDVLNEIANNFPNIKLFGSDGCMELLKNTNELNNYHQISFSHCFWSDLNIKFNESSFNLIFILGNSIAHISSIEELSVVLRNVNQLLKPGGIFLFDIRSWDNIAKNKSFNEPLCHSNKIHINKTLDYTTTYFYNSRRHFLIHDVIKKDSFELVERIKLSFIDFSKYDLIDTILSSGFDIMKTTVNNKDYYFDTFQLIKL